MALTNERAEMLANYLTEDTQRAKELLILEPAEALKEINGQGYDFTLEELSEYGEAVRAASAEGELEAEALDDVSGGSVTLAALVGAGFAVKVAYDVGRTVGKNAPW